MSNLNFFSWLRDGVRQSVLLGVNDAVEQLGTPPANEKLSDTVTGFLQPGPEVPAGKIARSTTKSAGSRKRLGKSLKELGNEAAS